MIYYRYRTISYQPGSDKPNTSPWREFQTEDTKRGIGFIEVANLIGAKTSHTAPFNIGSRVVLEIEQMPDNPTGLPDFLDGEWQSDGESVAPFRIVPVLEFNPHSTMQTHNGLFRSLYRDGKSYPIGDKLHVESKIDRLWRRAK